MNFGTTFGTVPRPDGSNWFDQGNSYNFGDTDVSVGASKMSLVMDTGRSASDLISSSGRVQLSTRNVGLLWQYSTDAGQNWQAANPVLTVAQDGLSATLNLPDGSYAASSVQVRQIDPLGRSSGLLSNQSAWTIDSVAPTITGDASARLSLNTAANLADLVFANPGGRSDEVLNLSVLSEYGTVGGLTDADANTPGIQLSGTAAQLQSSFASATFTVTQHNAYRMPSLGLQLGDTAGNTSAVHFALIVDGMTVL